MFNLYLTEESRSMFANENLQPLSTDKVVFIDSITGEKMGFEVKTLYIQDVVDDEGHPIEYYDPNGNELYLCEAVIEYE